MLDVFYRLKIVLKQRENIGWIITTRISQKKEEKQSPHYYLFYTVNDRVTGTV